MKRSGGFTLVEIMIVTALIFILAAIAIPLLRRSRLSANEAAAIGGTRTISTAELAFRTSAFFDDDGNGDGDYGTLAQLADPSGDGQVEPFIDAVLASGNKLGYTYTVVVTLGAVNASPDYTCVTAPAESGRTGYRQFFVDSTGVMRFTADGTVPNGASSPLE